MWDTLYVGNKATLIAVYYNMGIKKNFMFSSVLTVSNYIFPFIIYPYVARVLGVNNIGIVNFVDGVVNYAVMISMMGIAVVGIRDIAKTKNDPRELNATFTSLFILCALFTFMATIGLVCSTLFVDQLSEYKPLLCIGVLKLWSNFLLIDWLYKGLEDFRYITIRTILVKIGYLISVFIFVQNPSDYIVYYLLMCLMVTVNAMFNCLHAISKVRFYFRLDDAIRLAPPILTLGVYLILNSLHTTFNVVYLGFVCGDEQVGYYTTGTKIFSIILAIYTAYSGVVMPRASSLLSDNRIDEFKALIGKSIQALLLISVPVVFMTMIFSPGIVLLIAGPDFMGSIVPMTIIMPLIFIIGYEQIMVMQTLTPLATDRIILFISFVAAIIGVGGNVLLVKSFQAIGSSIVWLSSEIVALICAQYFVTKKIGIRFPFKDMTVNISAYLPCVIISLIIELFLPIDEIVRMLIGGLMFAVYFVIVQRYILHNPIYVQYSAQLVSVAKKRLNHRI